ncbi:Hypothetical predicted protein [Mytilus galloprovincialis]|uniref:G-protein coupled receptors family 2 profile 2 domain-containing protein n=1 Tax=Mytilus galloprovincialis TaxID=29158 RepID=A0A8B6E8N2_MYTGA|nr:Hypothetical predicted protein [Mytilus galloprovincialis]
MTSMWLVLFIANCIPISVNLDDDLRGIDDFTEQKGLKKIKYVDLLSQRIWQMASVNNKSRQFPIVFMDKGPHFSSGPIVFMDKGPHFSSGSALNTSEPEQNYKVNMIKRILKYKQSAGKSKKSVRSKKEHDILMDDITYGIFGSCYNISLFSDEPFVMIDKCPLWAPNYNDVNLCHSSRSINEFDKCAIDLELVPVTDNRGYIYKNIYCARCHGIRNITTWEVELVYNTYSPLRFFDFKQSMILLGKFKDVGQCVPFVYPLKPKGKLLCTRYAAMNLLEMHEQRSRYHRFIDRGDETSSGEYPLSFQILMNFGINGKGHVFFSTSGIEPVMEHHCGENEIYDPNIQECRRVVCKGGYVLIDKKCISKTQKYYAFTQQHIEDATQSDYPIQLIYRFNVSSRDVQVLKDPIACDDIAKAFADMLNISIDRVLNFEISLLNGTSPDTKVEIRRIGVSRDASNAFNNRNNSNADCNTHLSEYHLPVNLESVTAEISFSLFHSGDKGSNRSSNDTLKNKILNLKGEFNFKINGTEFKIDNPSAKTTVQLDLWCTKGQKDQKFEDEFEISIRLDKKLGRNVSGIYVNSTGNFYPPNMYDLWLWVTGKIGNISDVSHYMYVFICDMPKIANKDCARFQIASSNYTRLRNSSVLLDNNLVFDMHEYEYVNNRGNSTDIQVCVPKSYFIEPPLSEISFGCGDSYKDVLKAEGYLSFVLGIISIVVLTAVIVTYSLFAKLRNLPGLNMMCLTLSLCFGELIFIMSGSIDESSDIICPIVGVFLHFIFLASFFWMNVMSYDVFKTFANKCILTRVRRTKKHFPMYSLYAWGSPALIVGICSIIDFTKWIPNFRIGYGGSSGDSYEYYIYETFSNQTDNPTITKLYQQKFGCWIQEPVAALVAFGLPMIMILLANAIMFIRTIICIRSVTKMVSLRTRRSSVSNAIGQHDVILYVRMSTVMGFTWIFGLASSIVSSFSEKPTNAVCIALHVVGVFFIIFNCSQGLFIFFVFVLNRRVGALYKDLFGQCRGQLSRQSSASSSLHSVGTIQTVDENTNF